IAIRAALTHVEIHNTSINSGIVVNGSALTGSINATVTDSVVSNAADTAFKAISTVGVTKLLLVNSAAVNSSNGLIASGASATLLVGRTSVMGNTNGWQALSSGTLNSYGDNYINGNTANEGAMPLIGPK